MLKLGSLGNLQTSTDDVEGGFSEADYQENCWFKS